MSKDPLFLRETSLRLSRTLDEIGLNTFTVERRRHSFLYSEEVHNVFYQLNGERCSAYHFGSQTEGATTQGLDSDLDTLTWFHSIKVILDWTEWEQGKTNVLMLTENTAPGYCRLQLLRSDIPMPRTDAPNKAYTVDKAGRVILNNDSLGRPKSTLNVYRVRNGPAQSERAYGLSDNDFVFALKCDSWPEQAKEFIKRQRRHGWPSKSLIQRVVKCGCFFVPVGYKLSSTEHLEWRISASLAERYLLFSWNIVHLKCYVVLKMLIKTFVEPRVQKCISSYHCKTAVLHFAENVEPKFWRDGNLLECIIQCLVLLRTWVRTEFCPQFIMPKVNLFAGKVNANYKDRLQSIQTDLIINNARELLRVHIDGLGEKLRKNMNNELSFVPVLNSDDTLKLVGEFAQDKHACLSLFVNKFLVREIGPNAKDAILSVHKKIEMLDSRTEHAGKHKFEAIATFMQYLFSWLGSLLASLSLFQQKELPRMSRTLLRVGAKYDVSSMLKLSSIFYCNEEFVKCELILERSEKHLNRREILPICRCYDKTYSISRECCERIHSLNSTKARSMLIAQCLRFTTSEFHSVPEALRNEFSRSVGRDIHHRAPLQDEWMVMAAVDCLPFLYFLQYMTYRHTGKDDARNRSLNALNRCVRESHDFGHLETAWNLLGQCRELEQEPEAAMACYTTSLEIRRRNNVANRYIRKLTGAATT